MGVKDDFPDSGVLKIMEQPGEAEELDKWMGKMELFPSNSVPLEEMGREKHKRLGL